MHRAHSCQDFMPILNPTSSHSPGERSRRVLEKPQVYACSPSPFPVGEMEANGA